MTRDVAPRMGCKKPSLIHSKFFPALQVGVVFPQGAYRYILIDPWLPLFPRGIAGKQDEDVVECGLVRDFRDGHARQD